MSAVVPTIRRVTVATGSRAEKHLLAPIIRRLKKDTLNFRVSVLRIRPSWSLSKITQETEGNLASFKPHILLVSCDRREMVPVAMTGFYSNTPVFHFLGGITTYSRTWDDVGRRVIDNFSHIHLCESPFAETKLLEAGEEKMRIYVTGTTHFDDIVEAPGLLPESICPKEPYDLLLMNPVTLSEEGTREDVKKALQEIERDHVVFIQPNEDRFREIIIQEITDHVTTNDRGKLGVYPSLPRRQFLSLLQNAGKFISNSSSGFYEAPYFGVKVVNPSIRNQYRGPPIDRVYLRGGASAVVNVLRGIKLDDPKLLMKRFG